MQNGSVMRRNRKKHSDIWQFRWWEKTSDGKRIYRRQEIGTVDQIPDVETAWLAYAADSDNGAPLGRMTKVAE